MLAESHKCINKIFIYSIYVKKKYNLDLVSLLKIVKLEDDVVVKNKFSNNILIVRIFEISREIKQL